MRENPTEIDGGRDDDDVWDDSGPIDAIPQHELTALLSEEAAERAENVRRAELRRVQLKLWALIVNIEGAGDTLEGTGGKPHVQRLREEYLRWEIRERMLLRTFENGKLVIRRGAGLL